MAQDENGSHPQAEPEEQGEGRVASRAAGRPAQLVLGDWDAHVEEGPRGGKILIIDHFAQGTKIIGAFDNPEKANQLSDELKVSRAEVKDSAPRSPGGVVLAG